jgi:hypothetical protein
MGWSSAGAAVEGETLVRQGKVCLSWSALRGRGWLRLAQRGSEGRRARLGMSSEGKGNKQEASALMLKLMLMLKTGM